MKGIDIFLRKNSSTILSIIGSIGVIGTSVLAVKATPKALKLIQEYKENKEPYVSTENGYNKMTILETIKVAWKPYIPSILFGVSTIACIFGSNYINKKNQKALSSAYLLLESTYLRYRHNVNDIFGSDADTKVFNKMINEVPRDSELDESEGNLYFDCQSMRYFRSTPEALAEAELLFNQHLCTNGYAYLNDLYDLMGLERVDYGYELGWSSSLSDDIYAHDGVEFNMEMTELDDGLECWVISLSYQPSVDFMY